MPEHIEIDGPDGPTFVEITDAALSTLGRADAIAAAIAARRTATRPQGDALVPTPPPAKPPRTPKEP
jgi:hypothetical protein